MKNLIIAFVGISKKNEKNLMTNINLYLYIFSIVSVTVFGLK